MIMKCFNCGKNTNDYLCPSCRTQEILDKIFNEIRFYNPETCENVYLAEYVSTLFEARAERNCIPEILDLFPFEISEYYLCVYYWIRGKEEFETSAIKYLDSHDWADEKSQTLISYLLKKYIRNDFIKPKMYCEWIVESDCAYAELYLSAATYFGMIAEYDLSDKAADKGLACDKFLYSSKEYMQNSLEKQKADTLRYRTKKPYWPTTEERRRSVAMFYDEKGIAYPRIENKPSKIPENEFLPIDECLDAPNDYCAFWCAEAYSLSSVKPIYQIAAIRIKDGEVQDEFQSFIRPWDGAISRKSAAKEAGVPISVVESAEDVDQVMAKFFDFVGESVLVSTDALGTQAKLLCRAARYAGMNQLPCELYDLLDLAAETDSRFDLANNNRAYLLRTFEIEEGKDAVEKAKANVALYEALSNYDK